MTQEVTQYSSSKGEEHGERKQGDGQFCHQCPHTQSQQGEEDGPSCLERASQWIIQFLESSFYNLGGLVAHHPVLTILICLLVCGLCGLGLLKFKMTSDDADLWVPRYAQLLPQKQWVEANFPAKTRFVSAIVTAPNIMAPWVLQAVFKLYLKAQTIRTSSNKGQDDVCFKIGPNCYVQSMLELWSYDHEAISHMSLQDILDKVNGNIKYSPLYGTEVNLEYMLSGIKRDPRGDIIAAKALTINWVLSNDPQLEADVMEFEEKMISAITIVEKEFVIKSYVYATRSFDDEGRGAVTADTSLLTAGFITVFVFIILVLGRFNLVENKVYVSLCGILTIGLAILFSYGLAIACGLMYGPIHAMMPFLLLGVGVDDMFVIVSAWNNLRPDQRKLPVEEKMALSLKHAGVSITVTSITDIVAFGIGGSTVIPALSAFCGYAALGILGLYILVSTFFVAVMTLDQYRIEQNRNSVLCCYVHKDYVPNKCSQIDFVSSFMERFYVPWLMKSWCKVLVLIITIILTSVNLWSFTLLRQDFDLYDYLPKDSYATDYINILQKYYPDKGYEASVYCDNMDYYGNRFNLDRMAWAMDHSSYIQNGSVNFWYTAFREFVENSNDSVVTAFRLPDTEEYPLTRRGFSTLLPYFMQQKEGRAFGKYLKFDNSTPPNLVASQVPLVHVRQDSAAGDIEAMENLRSLLDNIGFKGGSCFCFAFKYINNEANKVLQGELYRNLALAAVCVFLVTLLLIANLWTSILVFTCVAFTVIDVTGTLQFWDVSIDIASSILIILCVGLAVDYSAHVGHTFMIMSGNRRERARATITNIGPAVLNGGFSTFLAFVLLVNSTSYGFVLFFRVFVSCVLFGLFHGLVYLPVLLSWIGPASHETTQVRVAAHKTDGDGSGQNHKLLRDDGSPAQSERNGFMKYNLRLYKTHNTCQMAPAKSSFMKGRQPCESASLTLNNTTLTSDHESHTLSSIHDSTVVIETEAVDGACALGKGEQRLDNRDSALKEKENVKGECMLEKGHQMLEKSKSVLEKGEPGSEKHGAAPVCQFEQCMKRERVCTVCVLQRLEKDIQAVMDIVTDGGTDKSRHCSCERHKSVCVCSCDRNACNCDKV